MNFEDPAKQYALELDQMKSLGARKNRIRQILQWAYAKGRESAVKDAYIDSARPAEPPPPMTFHVEG